MPSGTASRTRSLVQAPRVDSSPLPTYSPHSATPLLQLTPPHHVLQHPQQQIVRQLLHCDSVSVEEEAMEASCCQTPAVGESKRVLTCDRPPPMRPCR